MKSVNWGSIQARSDGEFERLPAGPYVAKIVDAKDNENREYIEVVFDIAEGPKAGYFSDNWGKNHPYAHHFFLSYKDSMLGMLKGRLKTIGESNQGFDPFAAWDAERLDMFVGRLVGVNIQEEEYEANDGSTKTRQNVCQVVPAQDVRDGKVKAREKKTLAPKTNNETVNSNDVYSADIPFD